MPIGRGAIFMFCAPKATVHVLRLNGHYAGLFRVCLLIYSCLDISVTEGTYRGLFRNEAALGF